MMLHTPIATQRTALPQWRDWPPAATEHEAMLHSYRRSGGLVTSDRAAALLGRHRDQPISQVARWIVAREIVSFERDGERWVPLFQFELADMSPRHRVTQIVSELVGAFDEMGVAAWFTRPSRWLRDEAPVVMVEINPESVLQAARADRYLARAGRRPNFTAGII